MLNRKSNLVALMPPKTINLPKRYVSNVTKSEISKNARQLSNFVYGAVKNKKEKSKNH